MENKFIVNIIHRPELSPEYAERALGKGKGVRDESIDIFRFQQDAAHKYGLKTTIQITYASLFSDVIVEQAKEEHEKYGDESLNAKYSAKRQLLVAKHLTFETEGFLAYLGGRTFSSSFVPELIKK